VADPCKTYKDALDKATKERDQVEGRLGYWEERIDWFLAEAQQDLDRAVTDCIDSEQRLEEDCVIGYWITAERRLEYVLAMREKAEDLRSELSMLRVEEETYKEGYCDCLNRQTPP
jgi:hypothetical protein